MTLGLRVAAVVPMVFLVNSTPDTIPADETAMEVDRARQAEEDFSEKEKGAAPHVVTVV